MSDTSFSREEGFLLLALISCLSDRIPDHSEIYSTILPTGFSIDKSQMLYIEGEYYKETNREIFSHFREISNELKLIGLNFVYLPKVGEHYQSLPEGKLLSLLAFLYPQISEKRIEEIVRQLTSLNTSDFCREGIVGKMNLKDLRESLPSVLLYINESYVEGKTYTNFLSITLERNVLETAKNFADLFVSLYKPRVLNPLMEGQERFIYRGYYKQVFDIITDRKGVRSSVVIDTFNNEIFLPEADVKLSKLHRREKALYALFLLESSSGGINFSKPENARALNLKSASNLNGNLNCSKELEHYAS